MNKLIAAAIALLLAGCANVPRPQMYVVPQKVHKAAIAPAPVVAAPDKPATFKERFRETFKKHQKWFH
jgi:hypothetical protein